MVKGSPAGWWWSAPRTRSTSEQAIFLLREEAESPDPRRNRCLKQAQAVADAYLLRTSPWARWRRAWVPALAALAGGAGASLPGGWAAAVSPSPLSPPVVCSDGLHIDRQGVSPWTTSFSSACPGWAKAPWGVLLAKTLGMTFLDTDLVIQEQEGALLGTSSPTGALRGSWTWRGVCAHLQSHRTVVATGGSVVYRSQAMAHLRELGTVVYLKLGYRALAKRLGSLKRRGWSSAPARPCGCSMRSGCPYEQYAHLTIDCSGQDVEHTLDRVMRALEKRGQG